MYQYEQILNPHSAIAHKKVNSCPNISNSERKLKPMKCKSHKFQHRFSLEGRFAGFAPHKKKPFKYLRLTTSDGEYCIKLPKYLQIDIVSRFTPGNWIRVAGAWKERLDGTIQFKADFLVHATPTSQTPMALNGDLQSGSPQSEVSDVKPSCSEESPAQKSKVKILVCSKSGCMKRGGRAVCQQLEALLDAQGLANQVVIKPTGCMDRCKAGPNLVVMPDKTRYSKVKPEAIPDLLHRHLSSQQ